MTQTEVRSYGSDWYDHRRLPGHLELMPNAFRAYESSLNREETSDVKVTPESVRRMPDPEDYNPERLKGRTSTVTSPRHLQDISKTSPRHLQEEDQTAMH
ncbi:MAG: hypothetical protein MPJ08_08855 [Nitrosopumilus sp.]|nr:hypothetical protein [Nitrosopumilus sp.]